MLPHYFALRHLSASQSFATLLLLAACALTACTENNSGSALEELDTSDSSSGSDTSGSSSGADTHPDTNPDTSVSCELETNERSCNATEGCSWLMSNCGMDDGVCFSNKEAPPPIKKCTIAPCEYRGTNATDCTANGDCRWLTPGCATEGQVAAIEGCYDLNDCSDTSCYGGYACVTVVHDPCVDKDCRACGSEVQVCMSAPPPPPSNCQLRAQSECAVDGNCRWLEPGSCDNNNPELLAFSAGCYPSIDCTNVESCSENTECREVSADPCRAGDCDACSAQAFLCLPDPTPSRGDCAQLTDEAACTSANMPCEWLTPGCGPFPTPEGCYPSDSHCTVATDCAEGEACVNFTHNPCRFEPCASCGADLGFCATY